MSVDTGTTAVVALDQIEVDPAENPRGEIDVRTLGELIASIEQHGVLQPVLVEPENGHYKLVAGYRRFLSAALAELTEIPVLIRELGESRVAAAVSENLPGLRKDMDPVAEGRAIKRVMQAESLTQRKAAKRLAKSEAFIADRLRLLRLPEAVQAALAAGEVPLTAAPELERIAQKSAALAELIAGALRSGEVEAHELGERPGVMVAHALSLVDESEIPAVCLGHDQGVDVEREVAASEERDALLERLSELRAEAPAWQAVYHVRLRDEDVDALRALGVLLEYEPEQEWGTEYRFVTDAGALVDRLGLVLDAEEKERAKQRKEAEKRARAATEASGVDTSEMDSEELAKAERRTEREERQAAKEQARTNNEELGHRLVRRRGRKVSAKRQTERARLAARAIVATQPGIGAALRLVREGWKEVEVTTLKNGKTRESVTYLEPYEGEKRFLEEIDRAKDAAAILELIAEALVAVEYASEDELLKSQETNDLYLRGGLHLQQPVAGEAKGVLPEALAEIAKRRAGAV